MIAILLADGFEEVEALTAYDLLRRAGCDTRLISFEETIATGAHGIIVCTDMYARAVNPDDIDLLVLPGGMPGVENLDKEEYTDKFINSVVARGARIGAICAAPTLLGRRGLLNGLEAVCYPGLEDKLTGATVSYSPVVTSGNITTSRGVGTAVDFALELVRLMKGEDEMKRIADSIVYTAPTAVSAKCDDDTDAPCQEEDDENQFNAYLSDEQFINAVEVAIKQGKVNTVLLQRKLNIGFGKASMFLNVMEGLSIVTEPNGQKPREVLITAEEWAKMLTKAKAKYEEPIATEVQQEVPDSTRSFEYDYTDTDETRSFKYNFEVVEDSTECEPKIPKKYRLPSTDLLSKTGDDAEAAEDCEEEINRTSSSILNLLNEFDAPCTIKEIERGPRITRYHVVPAKGVKVTKVLKLFDDLALSLAVEGLRMEAPVPGKSSIGIEVPNRKPSVVRLGDLVDTDTFKNEKSPTFVAIGKDVAGEPVYADVAKMPHLIVAGATGMGKSVQIHSIIASILTKATPEDVRFILIDPKKVEFTHVYSALPHLLFPVISDIKDAVGALAWAVEEMERRYRLLSATMMRRLDQYNEHVRKFPENGKPLPKIVIIIDELNDLMLQARNPIEALIRSIAQKARAAGIHLIIGTQRPTVNVLTGVIKANIPSRISFKVTSYVDSKTVLDFAGAEKLLGNGDMLFAPVGKPKPIRVQGAFISDSEIVSFVESITSKYPVKFDDHAYAQIPELSKEMFKIKFARDLPSSEECEDYFDDPQFVEILKYAADSEHISISLIQRKFAVGYSKAAKYLDVMEGLGLISESNGTKPRDVFFTSSDLDILLAKARAGDDEPDDEEDKLEVIDID